MNRKKLRRKKRLTMKREMSLTHTRKRISRKQKRRRTRKSTEEYEKTIEELNEQKGGIDLFISYKKIDEDTDPRREGERRKTG